MNRKKSFGTTLSSFCLSLFVSSPLLAQVPSYSTSDGVNVYSDYILSASMIDGAQNCGGGAIDFGWVVDTEAYFHHDGSAVKTFTPSTGGYFSSLTGVFTAPITGFYQVGASVRAERGNVDVSLRRNGIPVAALGTDLLRRYDLSDSLYQVWSTLSTNKSLLLNAGDTLNLWMESVEHIDCTFETSFKYNQFNVHLIRAVDLQS